MGALGRYRLSTIDDTMTISVARTREQVEHAPEYSNLDERSSEKLASYYA